MPELVPNPLYEAYANALRTVEPLIREIDQGIDAPYRVFRTGKVWTGPAAMRFDGQFAEYRTRVRAAGDRIVDDLHHAMSRTPREVTVEVAERLRAQYGLP